jgi:hypothetical protein
MDKWSSPSVEVRKTLGSASHLNSGSATSSAELAACHFVRQRLDAQRPCAEKLKASHQPKKCFARDILKASVPSHI